MGESLLHELKRPWELILSEPVPEGVEFLPADWAEKYFSAQLTVAFLHKVVFFIETGRLWEVSENKINNEAEEIASLDMATRDQYFSTSFHS